VCGFCDNENDMDIVYCTKAKCMKNRFGFVGSEVKPNDIIELLNDEIKILQNIF